LQVLSHRFCARPPQIRKAIKRRGRLVHPHVFRSPLGRHRAVIAYQVRQTDSGANIDVQLIGDLRVKDLQGEIEGALRKVGLANPEITVTLVDSLDRGATGKLKRFVPLGFESSTH
jgi:hypothetical protein